MLLSSPIFIGSRLLPAIKVGDAVISIGYSDRLGTDTRTRYVWHIDMPEGEYAAHEYSGEDLQSGCSGNLRHGLESLLTFLGAAGEAYAYQMRTGRESDNAHLFEADVVEWAYQNSDEIETARMFVEEYTDCIVE